jgi:2-iminobutanoate/2-iminopropanoate deaminase
MNNRCPYEVLATTKQPSFRAWQFFRLLRFKLGSNCPVFVIVQGLTKLLESDPATDGSGPAPTAYMSRDDSRRSIRSTLKAQTERTNKKFVQGGTGVPRTSSPISQAVVSGQLCFVSGQLPVDSDGLLKKGTIESQSRLALANLISVLRASGFSLKDIVYIDVALLKIDDLEIVNKLFVETFDARRRPARTVYQAVALPLGSPIKFQAIACKG